MIGIFFRNLLAWTLCVLAAAGLVVPAGYVVVKMIVNEQNGQPPLFTPPIAATLIALGIAVAVIAVIMIIGAFLVRLPSLWTASALTIALPALHLAVKLIPQHIPVKFMEAWTPLTAAIPDWGWWTAFGVSLAFYLFCGPFGKGEQQPEPEPTPAPAKKK